MAIVPNVPTDYSKLDPTKPDDARLLASKSGKSPFDAALLQLLARIAVSLEIANSRVV